MVHWTTMNAAPERANAPVGGGGAVARIAAEVPALLTVVVVSGLAAGFAHQFRELIFRSITVHSGTHSATQAAGAMHPALLFLTVTGGLIVAAWLGRRALAIGNHRLGLSVIAAAARGEGPGPSVVGTLVRSTGTVVASVGLASLGRESAILESGGALGSGLATQLRKRMPFLPADLGPALAAAGIAAAFAAAYHAPLAGMVYVEEHLGVRRRRRSLIYSLVGVLTGHLIAVEALGGKPVFAAAAGARSDVVLMGAIAVVPAVIGSTMFRLVRDKVGRLVGPGSSRSPRWMAVSAVAAGVVAVVSRPVAGNGMEAIRLSATGAAVGLFLALAFGKLFATAAAIGAGAPGGVFTPSMAVAAGWALVTFEVLRRMGVGLPGPVWSGVLAALAVGIAVGLESPLVAVLAIPEMTGDLRLLPAVAVVVFLAVGLQRSVREVRHRRPTRPAGAVSVHDEDA